MVSGNEARWCVGRLIAVAVLVLAVTSCGPDLVQSDVTRFTTLPAAGSAHSFTIMPDQGQRGSLEFEAYARMVDAQLEALGWRPIAGHAGAEAETIVTLHWGVGSAHTEVWTSPSWVDGAYGWAPRYGGVMEPYPSWDVRAITTYPKWVAVDIVDGSSVRASTPMKLFEGRAVTSGRSSALTPAMPYMIKALFTGFPGASGQTVRVDIPVAQ
jgi:hypothetical protein